MPGTVTRECSAPQAALFQRNEWKLVTVGPDWVRIHPPESETPISPSGPTVYQATVEHVAPQTAGVMAEPACEDEVVKLFYDAIASFTPFG